jgi:hypothetical protein
LLYAKVPQAALEYRAIAAVPSFTLEAFPADEARRLVERFEWHYSPKHGSRLNLAESELGVLSCQCLNRRMSDKRFLKREVAAWEANRNKKHTKANWRFTTDNARVKLKHLYPSFGLTRATSLLTSQNYLESEYTP